MESKNVALTDIINDLIQVNKGRIKGYNSAMVAGKGIFEDLKAFFNEMILQAEEHINNLELKMAHLEGSSGSNSSVSEKMNMAWKDIKWAFTGTDRGAILNACADSEIAAVKAYEEVLRSDAEMSAETRQIIIGQKENIETAVNQLKNSEKVIVQ